MTDLRRNSSNIDRSVRSTLVAAVLTSVAPVIASVVDGIFVSNLVGRDAFSAISLVLPVIRIVTVLMLICHMGANILASRAIGRGDTGAAREQFSVAVISSLIIGVVSCAITALWPSAISTALSRDAEISSYIGSYMAVMAFNFPFVAIASTLNFFISGEGYPGRTSRIVLISSLSNIVFDWLFISVLDMGIAGAAWGTVLSSAINVILHLPFLLSGKSRYRMVRTGRRTGATLKESLKQGFAFNIINITLNLFLIFANALMERHLGSSGYYQWGICIQMQMFLICVCSGSVSGAVFLGNTLLGEGDARGVSYVVNRLLVFHVIFYSAVTVLMTAFPGAFTYIFGIRSAGMAQACRFPFFCFSLYFMGYCFVCAYTNVFQMMGYVKEKIFFIVAFSAVVALCIGAGSAVSTFWMWLGLPVGAVLVVTASLLFAYGKHRKNPAMTLFTLQYRRPHSIRINCSVRYDSESEDALMDKISRFAAICELTGEETGELVGICRKLCSNIRRNTSGAGRYYDFKMSYTPEGIKIISKNTGIPDNPAEGIGVEASYRYGYGMNITSIQFVREGRTEPRP